MSTRTRAPACAGRAQPLTRGRSSVIPPLSLPLHRPAPKARRRQEVDAAEWNDWRWQLRHRLTQLADLEQFVALTDEERRGVALAPELFRVGITPYYASLMDRERADCPVRMQAIPLGKEERVARGEYVDPLGEDGLSPAPSIVHRYPDRVLLLALDRCADLLPPLQSAAAGRAGRRRHQRAAARRRRSTTCGARRQIRDVLISGGDPLTLSTEKLEWIVGERARDRARRHRAHRHARAGGAADARG